ncbi:hypothetical protein GCM10009789_82940 [Kribbella sancticallisti]|uniref:Helix-turn-helix domain-containing protein n=1 Tax=Kribbella sancticallisti TaxID=460087 RepID=A0ABP4QSQ1_9ACTN
MTQQADSDAEEVEPATGDETRAALLERSKRQIALIRREFVQLPPGSPQRASVLSGFVSHRDKRALNAYLLLLAIGDSGPGASGPNTRLPLAVWARAFDTDLTTTGPSATAAASKVLTRLEDRKLITRARRGRERQIQVGLLREDGSGEPYTRPGTGNQDRFLALSNDYWTEGWHEELDLPGIAMLLVALHEKPGFRLPAEHAPRWYGWSADTTERGFAELVDANLLRKDSRLVKAPLSPTGLAKVNEYRLLPPFAPRQKAPGRASPRKSSPSMSTRRRGSAAATRRKATQ